jgi:hypothetical protein
MWLDGVLLGTDLPGARGALRNSIEFWREKRRKREENKKNRGGGGDEGKCAACSFDWWLMAGAGFFWEKSTAGWLLVADLFWEKTTVGWWLISQANRAVSANVPYGEVGAHLFFEELASLVPEYWMKHFSWNGHGESIIARRMTCATNY